MSRKYEDIPEEAFKLAITGIKNRLHDSLGASGLPKLIDAITSLPKSVSYMHSIQTMKVFTEIYPPQLQNDIKGLILLLKPEVLLATKYPSNIRNFVEIFHVQEDDLSYLDHKDPGVGYEIREIACEVLGISSELVHD